MWEWSLDITTKSELTVFELIHWFHTQTGTAGVVLFAAAVLAAGFFLLRRQVQKQGAERVAKIYGVLLLLGFGLHTVLGSGGELSPVSNELTQIESVDTSNRLEGIEERLGNTRRKAALQRTELPRSDSLGAELDNELLPEEEQVDWKDLGQKILWAALGLVVLLCILRMHPEIFNPLSLKRLLPLGSDWIRPMRSKSNELGSSDLATPAQVKRWLKRKDKYDTVLPVTDLRGSTGVIVRSGEMIIPVGERNRHVLIIAKTGSGKTTKLILPILYNDCMCPHRSTIIIDSKQEMWDKLAGLTRKHNPHKNIVLFNPLDTLRSRSWNILSKVHSDTDCKLIANSIIMATDEPQAKQDSPFFRNNALQILNAMMVGLMHDPNEVLSMPRIHQLINRGMLELCDWLEAHPDAIRTTQNFVGLARSGSQNADTIMSELSMRLQAWDLKAIRATTFENEFDIQTLVTEPTLFVVELRESELKMLRPLANVIVVELLRYLTKYAEECPNQSLPRPVGLVIDEFASALGRLPDIHIKLNTLRSRNVSIVAAIQSIGQIKGNYGEDWESVLSGFSTKIFMPSLDYTDAEWASKESGIMTVRYRTASKGTNRKITENFSHRNASQNEQIQQRQVLTPGEVGRPSDNQATFFMPETPVFQGHLTPYYKVPHMIKHFEEFKDVGEIKLREAPIEYEEEFEPVPRRERPAEPGANGRAANGAANSDELSEEEVWAALEDLKSKRLDWENTVGDAKKWWEAFEEENKNRIALVLKVAHEIEKRDATITDFFLAYVYSNTDNIQATLAYLDYTMHMKAAGAS